MDAAFASIAQFAAAHPFYYAVITGGLGFFAKAFIFTKENARKLIKWWFDHQRAALKRAGRSPDEIKAVMEEEADFLLAAATEAKSEADTEGAAPPATPAP